MAHSGRVESGSAFVGLTLGRFRRFQFRARIESSVKHRPVPPDQTVLAVLPHTALRSSSSQDMRVC